MKKIGLASMAALLAGLAVPANAATLIDFETDGDGNGTVAGNFVGQAYSNIGVVFVDALFFQCGGGCPAPAFGRFVSGRGTNNPFSVIFSTDVSGFSFENVSNSGGTASALDSGGNPIETVQFSGFPGTFSFTSSNIRSVQFAPGIQFGVDNFRFTASSAVPEPGTWLMMLLGFGLAGAAVRASKRRQNVALTYA